MQSKAITVDQYIDELPEERKIAVAELRKVIKSNIPKGFQESMGYGMVAYTVPHSKYPSGYHCDPKLPLPFINFASQKNFIAIYHMGIYADPKLLNGLRTLMRKHLLKNLTWARVVYDTRRRKTFLTNL